MGVRWHGQEGVLVWCGGAGFIPWVSKLGFWGQKSPSGIHVVLCGCPQKPTTTGCENNAQIIRVLSVML